MGADFNPTEGIGMLATMIEHRIVANRSSRYDTELDRQAAEALRALAAEVERLRAAVNRASTGFTKGEGHAEDDQEAGGEEDRQGHRAPAPCVVSLELVPVRLTDRKKFIERHHRHLGAPVSGLFAVGVAGDGELRGVAIIGRPVSRVLDDEWTVEVTRLGTDGVRNGCSILYGAAWRAAKAMGYRRAVTYTSSIEPGSSLKAVGWCRDGKRRAEEWDTPARRRKSKHSISDRVRWRIGELVTPSEPPPSVEKPGDGPVLWEE